MTFALFWIGLAACLIVFVLLFAFLVWLVPQKSLRLQEGNAMIQLTSQGWGYSYYNGWDENDSRWIEKRLDDWFGRRIRSVKRDRADIEDLTIHTDCKFARGVCHQLKNQRPLAVV